MSESMLTRVSEVKEQSQAIGDFLEWLAQTKDLRLGRAHAHGDGCFMPHRHDEDCVWRGKRTMECYAQERNGALVDRVCGLQTGEMVYSRPSTDDLLAEFFEIDLQKLEQERRALLDQIRGQGS